MDIHKADDLHMDYGTVFNNEMEDMDLTEAVGADLDFDEAALEESEQLVRLNQADVRRWGAAMTTAEARHVVNDYYRIQQQRIRTAAQMRAAAFGEAMELTIQFHRQTLADENTRKLALNAYAKAHPVGRWSLEVKGIGPVIAAGLLAHIDITRSTNVGKLWRFAGLDPTLPRPTKGEKRQHNAKLKRLCWLMGESFTKVSGRDDAVYGKVYVNRKAQEISRNEACLFADQAQKTLDTINLGKDTEAYKWYAQGKLPPARIHLRAQRYAVKLFLSHWHYVAFETEFGVPPEKPYILTQPEHQDHFIAPPNWPMD